MKSASNDLTFGIHLVQKRFIICLELIFPFSSMIHIGAVFKPVASIICIVIPTYLYLIVEISLPKTYIFPTLFSDISLSPSITLSSICLFSPYFSHNPATFADVFLLNSDLLTLLNSVLLIPSTEFLK